MIHRLSRIFKIVSFWQILSVNPPLRSRLLGRGKVKMQVISAFGFWDFKIPKAFRPQLFTCYRLTDQDSIYKITNNGVSRIRQKQ